MNENNSEHPFNGAVDGFSNALADRLKTVMHQFKASTRDISSEYSHSDAFIYPLIQINDCGIRTEEIVIEKLFQSAPVSSSIYLAVGYFNLTNNYIDVIVKQSAANYKILLSSPEANGFFGSNGFSSNIPAIYSYLEEEFLNYFTKYNQDKRISMHEYKRDKWSKFKFKIFNL